MTVRTRIQKSSGLFIRNGFNFFKIFLVFFAPLIVLHYSFWDNDANIHRVIDRFGLVGFAIIDDSINYLLLVYLLLYLAAIVKSIDARAKGGNAGMRSSYRKALGVFGSYLWVKILTLFKVLCWSLLLIVPGVIAGFLYSFGGMAMLIDGKRGKDALNQSCQMIKPKWARYLANVVGIITAALISCIAVTLLLNSYIPYFTLRGHPAIAKVFIYAEIILYAFALSYFMTLYYGLYEEFKK